MRNAVGFSVLFHSAVLVIGYFGLPYIQSSPLMTDIPIMVEIVNVEEKTNAPPPAPKPDKKPKQEAKKEEPKKPPPPPKASPPPPPPEPEEVAALPPEPKAKPKPKPKPKPKLKLKPKPKPKAQKPKPARKLAKVKSRRKPKPPDAFASVLKTVEKLKARPKAKEKKEEKKKPPKKEKAQTFEQQIAQALASQTARHNPLRPLAISEIDLVRQQIRECWSLPAGAREAEDLSIEIKMAMNPDGTVRQARILDQGRLQTDPFFRAAAESALRAVLNPRCNPLKLPPEKYQRWQNMTLIFDPQQMF